jgi:twinkle protein
MGELPATATTADGRSGSRLTASGVSYAETVRKISRATLERFGVRSGTAFFPETGVQSEAMFFPYLMNGEMVNWKAHGFPNKAFTSMKGGKAILFNLDAVKNSETVYVTEGEWDCLSLFEAGVPQNMVASVPGGAPEKPREDGKPHDYRWAEEALEAGLKRAKRIIWCGDMDGPGRLLREDMAAIMGPARFWFVEWPEGCKDANDMLRSDGPDRLRELVMDGALSWPIDGLYQLAELPESSPLTLWKPGFPEWGEKVMLAPGTLSVLTGLPGHGKTTVFAQIWFHVAQSYGLVAAVAAFENRTKPHYRRMLRQAWAGKPEREMSGQERSEADRCINDHYRWIVHPEEAPSLDWILDMAEAAVIRHGARIVQIDPWNRLESQRTSQENETDYIRRCLKAAHVFAKQMNCHVQIVAHPGKRDGRNRDRLPDLEDISGSMHWFNMPDQGFVVHRRQFWDEASGRNYDAEFMHKKARFEDLGFPCTLDIRLNPHTGRFQSTIGERA